MTSIDHAKREAFAGRMTNMLNDGFLAMMSSIGHQTGLFDVMSDRAPSTSEEIAHASGLNERYVREWLGAMVTGQIIDYEPASLTYHLPPEHAASVTRASGTGNIAAMLQWVGVMGAVEPRIVECFEKGGGLGYSEYERFHAIMADSNARIFDHTLTQTTLPLVPGVLERLRSGIDVLDVGCGSGHAINVMAGAYPKSRFVGYDFSEEGVETGRAEAAERGLTNARFEVRDVASAGDAARFDFITSFDSIHDQAQPASVLAGICASLRDGGTYLMVDIAASSLLEENLDHPLGSFLYSISVMHCMSVSLALEGEGLGTVWGEQKAIEMLAAAGFGHVEVKRVEGDVTNNYYIATKSAL